MKGSAFLHRLRLVANAASKSSQEWLLQQHFSVKTKSIQSIKKGANTTVANDVRDLNSNVQIKMQIPSRTISKQPTPGSKFDVLDASHQPRRCLLP